jgi:hypothetical protein
MRRSVIAGTIALLLAAGVKTGDSFTYLPTTLQSGARTRARTGVDFTFGGLDVGYRGLHERDFGDSETYFGKDVITAGRKGSDVKGSFVIKTGPEGVKDVGAGIRYTGLAKRLDGYGFLDILSDLDAVNLTMLYGRDIGPFDVSILHALDLPYKRKPHHYTEIEVDKNIGSDSSLFGRVEFDDVDVLEGIFRVGLSRRF